MVLSAQRWFLFLALSMRLEVRTQLNASSLRNSAMTVRVMRLYIFCSCSGQTQYSSGRMRQSSLRVSSLTQLFILLRTSFWKRQQRFRPMLLVPVALNRFKRRSTTRCDFSFFWIWERIRRMMLGMTLRFSICFDFLGFLGEAGRGRYSSSSIFLKGRQSLKFGYLESLSVLQWPSLGSGLRMMFYTTDFLHSELYSILCETDQLFCNSGQGRIQGRSVRGRPVGKTKQN